MTTYGKLLSMCGLARCARQCSTGQCTHVDNPGTAFYVSQRLYRGVQQIVTTPTMLSGDQSHHVVGAGPGRGIATALVLKIKKKKKKTTPKTSDISRAARAWHASCGNISRRAAGGRGARRRLDNRCSRQCLYCMTCILTVRSIDQSHYGHPWNLRCNAHSNAVCHTRLPSSLSQRFPL